MIDENIFRDEAGDMLNQIEATLISSEEKRLNSEQYTRISRILHSLKGSCLMCGYEGLEPIIHNAESLFKQCESNPLTSPIVNQLLALIDKCREVLS